MKQSYREQIYKNWTLFANTMTQLLHTLTMHRSLDKIHSDLCLIQGGTLANTFYFNVQYVRFLILVFFFSKRSGEKQYS